MICLNPVYNDPKLAGIVAGGSVLLYMFSVSYVSSVIPPILAISLAIGVFVYYMMGGQLLCKDPEFDAPDVATGAGTQAQTPMRDAVKSFAYNALLSTMGF